MRSLVFFAFVLFSGGRCSTGPASAFNPDEWDLRIVNRNGITQRLLKNGDRELVVKSGEGGSAFYEGDTRVAGPTDNDQTLFQTLQAVYLQDGWTDAEEDIPNGRLIIHNRLSGLSIYYKEGPEPEYFADSIKYTEVDDEDDELTGFLPLKETEIYKRALMDLKIRKYRQRGQAVETESLYDEEELMRMQMTEVRKLENWSDVERKENTYSMKFLYAKDSMLSFNSQTKMYTLSDSENEWEFTEDDPEIGEAEKALIGMMKRKMQALEIADRRRTWQSTVQTSMKNLAPESEEQNSLIAYEVDMLNKMFDYMNEGGLKTDDQKLEGMYEKLLRIKTHHLYPLRDQLLSLPFGHSRSLNPLEGFVKRTTLNELFDTKTSSKKSTVAGTLSDVFSRFNPKKPT